jgi:hypothetical protein
MTELSHPCLTATTPHPAQRAARAGSILAVAAEARTYRSLAYLLLALPLGVAYFLVLAVGFVLGTGLAVTLIGLPILLAVAAASWRLVDLERRLAAGLLGEAIPATHAPVAAAVPVPTAGWRAVARDRAALAALWRGVAARLADPGTFRGLAFLVAKLPLGLVSFAAVAVAYGAALGLLLAPVTYRVDALAVRLGPLRVDTMEEAAVAFFVAPLAILAAMHVSNALAAASGRVARLLLAPPDGPPPTTSPWEGAPR